MKKNGLSTLFFSLNITLTLKKRRIGILEALFLRAALLHSIFIFLQLEN